jgi:uncharacterized protein YidB (DUF937 family)
MDLKEQAGKLAGELGGLLKGGGAKNVLDKLGGLGLGNVASSWVGLGKNLPISPDMISKVLGSGALSSIAAKLGISEQQASKGLADALPEAIDHMTPDGQPPTDDAEPPDPIEITRRLFGGGAAGDAPPPADP